MEAGEDRTARAARPREALSSVRDLRLAADSSAGARARQRMDPQTEFRTVPLRTVGAGSDAGRTGRRPLCGPPVSGRGTGRQGLMEVLPEDVPVIELSWTPCHRLIG